jgi:hypothetical protein
MPDLHIHVPSDSDVMETVSGIPSEVKTYLGKGFAVLARLPEDKLAPLMDAAKEHLGAPVAASRDEVASTLGVEPEDATALMTAVSFATFSLTSRGDKAEDFVKALTTAKIVTETQQPQALRVAQAIVNNRLALKEALQRSRVAAAVLPSLIQFETTIDLRLGFEKNQVGFAVPVVVMHVDTDAQGEELWLQVNKKQLENLIRDLEEARRRLDQAEKWVGSRFARE